MICKSSSKRPILQGVGVRASRQSSPAEVQDVKKSISSTESQAESSVVNCHVRDSSRGTRDGVWLMYSNELHNQRTQMATCCNSSAPPDLPWHNQRAHAGALVTVSMIVWYGEHGPPAHHQRVVCRWIPADEDERPVCAQPLLPHREQIPTYLDFIPVQCFCPRGNFMICTYIRASCYYR